MNICYEFSENPDWRKHPDKTRGVTWDGWCSKCGAAFRDLHFDDGKGLGVSHNGVRWAETTNVKIIDSQEFRATKGRIHCSNCVPSIK